MKETNINPSHVHQFEGAGTGGIIFVYNADSGILNGIKDVFHKNFAPQTYQCRLCAITYNNLGMFPEWKKFVHSLGMPVEFLHRDEMERAYGLKNVLLPAAFILQKDMQPRLWITAGEMNECRTLPDLKQLIQKKLA